jgi:oligopeptide/dipeptide ABC transporter ATP-binding protein
MSAMRDTDRAPRIGDVVLDVRDLRVVFDTRRGRARAVDGVTLSLRAGETLGLVGESGCGKTITALSLIRSVPAPGRIDGGTVTFEGCDLLAMPEPQVARLRGRRIALIPQDPLTALNPVMTVGDHLTEVLDVHLGIRGEAAKARAADLIARVGIPEPRARLNSYPHQLSGGMRQRVMIALAIACQPAVLIADEPTTALDATVQAQILELLDQLKHETGMSLLLITHNLGIVAGHCDRVAVMYCGRLAETAPVADLFIHPHHRYTAGLLACVPRLDRQNKGVFYTIPGIPPELTALPPGCAFAARCDAVIDRCRSERPELVAVDDTGAHRMSCWNPAGIGDATSAQATVSR